MKTWNRILNGMMIFIVGGFAVNSLAVVWNHKVHPEQYVFFSAPWYTGILLYGCIALIVLAVCVIAKLVLRHIMKKRK